MIKKKSFAEVPKLKPPAALTIEQISEGTNFLSGKIFSICPSDDSSKQRKEEQAAGLFLCDAGWVTHRGCCRSWSMSEQFPWVYSGLKEGGCLWEEAVITEAKIKKPQTLPDWGGDNPFLFKLYQSLKSLSFTLKSEISPDFATKIRLV